MFIFNRVWIALIVFASLVAMPIKTFAQTPTVIFSEIAWAGSSYSSSDEWLELSNLTDTSIDISGWIITGAGSSENNLVVPDGSAIEPYSTFLITNYAASHENTALVAEPNFSTATLSLPNDGFSTSLYDNDGSLIDVAGADGAAFAGRSGSTADTDDGRYRSMVRIYGNIDGSDKAAWTDAQESSGFKEGVEDLGMPGVMENWLLPTPATSYSPDTMQINEFVVDPNDGETEWIEIVNSSNQDINTTGWTVEDATEKTTELDPTVLSPGDFTLVEAPKGILNNGTDTITLRDGVGTAIDSVTYGTEDLPAPEDGEALARDVGGDFVLTQSTTPGEVNVILMEEEQDETIESDEDSSSESNEAEEEEALVYPSGVMHINEFVVDPNEGEDEWIEIVNSSTENIDTTRWTVEDSTEKTTELESIMLSPGDYLVIEKPRGILNNNTDTIVLRDGTGSVIDSVTYGSEDLPAPKDGDSLARNADGTFSLTQSATPGEVNVISTEEEVEKVEEVEEEVEVAQEVVQEEFVEEVIEETEMDDSTQSPLDEAPYSGPTTLQFTKLYPNTSGPDAEEEFIELTNTGLESINLKDWSIKDGSADQYMFPNTLELASGTTLRVDRSLSSITLNNKADTLELIAPTGEVIDTVAYESAPKGGTYDRADDLWSWSTDAEVVNVVTAAEASPAPTSASTQPTQTTTTSSVTTTSSQSSTATSPSSYVSFFSIEQAGSQADGTRVRIEGYVTAIAGTFGRQIMYIQDQTGGVQVYFYDASYPDLTLDTQVRVEGTMSTAYGERRVKVSETSDIQKTGNLTKTSPEQISIGEIGESTVGTLVQTSGQILSRTSTKLKLEDGENGMTVYLKSNPEIDANQFQRGDSLTVTGVLTTYNGELRVRPRTQGDIIIDKAAEAILATTTDSGKALLDDQQSKTGVAITLVVVTLLATLALIKKFPRRREALGI